MYQRKLLSRERSQPLLTGVLGPSMHPHAHLVSGKSIIQDVPLSGYLPRRVTISCLSLAERYSFT